MHGKNFWELKVHVHKIFCIRVKRGKKINKTMYNNSYSTVPITQIIMTGAILIIVITIIIQKPPGPNYKVLTFILHWLTSPCKI